MTHIFKELLINEQITIPQVRLLGLDGEALGIMATNVARQRAEHEGVDLAMISPNAVPPVCKLMDYGKFKFDSMKKEKELKKNQKVAELKEIQLSMTIEAHDMQTKAKHGNRFLQDGDKIKVALRMKGREQAYAKNAIAVCKQFYELLADKGVIDKEPVVMGRNVIMIVSPKK